MLFPPVPAFPLRDGGAALLVLDLQPFMVDRSVGLGRRAAERGIERELDEYYEQVEYALQNAADLVRAFRADGLPIVFTRLAAPPSGESATSIVAYGGALPARDSPEAQIVALLAPPLGSTTETVLVKHTLSPFASTSLDKLLDGLGIR